MPRRSSRPFTRKNKYRDAKTIVIATEGELTEPVYFNDLVLDDRFRNPRVQIQVIPSEGGLSAPTHVIQRLDKLRRKHGFYEGDELWLVIDKDRWKDRMLSEVTRQAQQKGYFIADSNPCFETWLLLHFDSLDELKELTCETATKCDKVITKLTHKDFDPSYTKSKMDTAIYIDRVLTAIANAKQMDVQSNGRYLNQIGSRVYRLVESIIQSSPNNPLN